MHVPESGTSVPVSIVTLQGIEELEEYLPPDPDLDLEMLDIRPRVYDILEEMLKEACEWDDAWGDDDNLPG